MRELAALGEHVRAELEASAEPDEALRASLSARAATRDARRRRRVALASFGVAAAVVTATLFVLFVRATPESALTFTVGIPERPGVVGESISAAERAGTSLRFSEGSRAALDPSARVRVVRSTTKGAELELEAGRAHIDVVPRPGNVWLVRAGPFSVRVTGTRFTMAWSAATDAFALELFEGHVTVSGCSFGSGRIVSAGERVEGRCRPEARRPAMGLDTVLPEAVAPEKDERNAPERAAAPLAQSEEWPLLARRGHFERAYALAARAGIEAEAKLRAVDDVLLLGEAARLTGHADDARFVYQVVRLRSPKTAVAAQAAFHLGTLEARAGKRALAAEFFETYLSEQPRGPLASAALGRLIEARVALGDGAGARDAAKNYLESYPLGPHADEAKKVLSIEARKGRN
jgi:transmembrane sensor